MLAMAAMFVGPYRGHYWPPVAPGGCGPD